MMRKLFVFMLTAILITSIDDKTEAFNKAQNKWNELNEHHFKDHYVPHFS